MPLPSQDNVHDWFNQDQGGIYEGGIQVRNNPINRGANGIVANLAQAIGRNEDLQPEPIKAVGGGLVTARGLVGEAGTHFVYYVRGSDTSNSPGSLFVNGSEGRVKKIVTFPKTTIADTIVRITTFTYQNQSFPTKTTVISDYEEPASWYFQSGNLAYDANSSTQNSVTPNT